MPRWPLTCWRQLYELDEKSVRRVLSTLPTHTERSYRMQRCAKSQHTERSSLRGRPPARRSSSEWPSAKAVHSEVSLGQEWKQNPVNESKRQNNREQKAALWTGYAQEPASVGLTGLWGSILSQLQPRVPSGTRHACSWAPSQPRSQTPRAARGGSYTLHQEQPLAPSDTHSRARCTVRRILLFYRYFSSALNAVMLPLRSPPEHSCCSHRLKLRYDRILTIHCTI